MRVGPGPGNLEHLSRVNHSIEVFGRLDGFHGQPNLSAILPLVLACIAMLTFDQK